MTSSSSNSNNRLSDYNETNPGFNTMSFTASGSGVSSNVDYVTRKQTSNNKNGYKFVNYSVDARVAGADRGLGFNELRSSKESVFGDLGYGNVAKEMYLFGGNEGNNDSKNNSFGSYLGLDRVDANVAVDNMSKLNVGYDKGYSAVGLKERDVGKLMVDEVVNETVKLRMEGASNVESTVESTESSLGVDTSNVGGSDRYEKVGGQFAFTSRLDDIRVENVEFKTPDMRKNMFSGVTRFESRNEHVKERLTKKKGRMKKPVVDRSKIIENFVFGGRGLAGNLDGYDIPLYDEMLAGGCSREASVTSEASQVDEQDNASNESRVITSNVSTDDEVFEPQVNEASETESLMSAAENLEYGCDNLVTSLDSDVNSNATSGRQESGATRVFSFGSRSEDISNDNFTFGASSSGQNQVPSDTRQHRKKPPLKITRDSYISTKAKFFPLDLSASSSIKQDNMKLVNDFRHESLTSSSLSSSKAAEEACEKWRLRGNQAYSNGDLAKAEDCYTQGLNSVSENEKSASCLRAVMLCYSNRAAARMSLGRMKEALEDCLMAATIDPNFLKAQVRAAHCYLAMGEIDNAKQQYMACLQFGNGNSTDKKVLAEASEGLEKVQQVLNCIEQCTDLLQTRASEDLECALRLVNDALHISACSDKLLQLKADSLFMLRRYEEVIQTLTSDKANTPTGSSFRPWRSYLIIKSYFYLGRLDEALEFIKKHENSEHITKRDGYITQESAIPLADTIRELLSYKTAGNEAYKSGKHSEAVEHYTAALSCSVESRLFAAVCFCNRAAAYRALGQITDGIADCSLAIALDPNYLKAISRRANLHEMIRDYGQAAKDLQRLVSLLTTQMGEKGAVSGASDNLSSMNELKQTQMQLSNVEMESRKGIPLNAYLILGVESTASAADIKKAYRKAALRHHPDKAAQLLGRGVDGDDGLRKEIAENVHKDADRLFKMIGEAYAVLSNPSKRSKYDQDEEKRNEVNRFTRSNSSRMAADVQNSVFEQSGNEERAPVAGF